jgi:hypothetical protein
MLITAVCVIILLIFFIRFLRWIYTDIIKWLFNEYVVMSAADRRARDEYQAGIEAARIESERLAALEAEKQAELERTVAAAARELMVIEVMEGLRENKSGLSRVVGRAGGRVKAVWDDMVDSGREAYHAERERQLRRRAERMVDAALRDNDESKTT